MKTILLIFSFLSISFVGLGKSKQEKRGEEINFQSIKNILENDFLKKSAIQKAKKFKKIKKKRLLKHRAKFSNPKEEHFWRFFSEFWLVRNAQRLKWDFESPDYGLQKTVVKMFERFGFFEQKFKLLLLNDSSITHMALPGNPSEIIFILSIPFIRTIDLTKQEIGILLVEDYVRLQMKYFLTYVRDKKLQDFIGGRFVNKKAQHSLLNMALKRADEFIYEKGFNFQQQFDVTRRVSALLRSDTKLWNSYLSLLRKVDNLVKSNKYYKNYTKIYPSPEIQLKWILPEKKVL